MILQYGKEPLKDKLKIIKWIKKQDIICLDIESKGKFNGKLFKQEGLDPYTSEITSIQFGNNTKYIMYWYNMDLDVLKAISKKLCIGHNIKFDIKFIKNKFNIEFNNVFCTLVAEKIITNEGINYDYSLSGVLKRTFNIKLDKEVRSSFIDTFYFNEEQEKYALDDILYLERLYDAQLKQIKVKKLEETIKLEMKYIPVIVDMELNGMHLNDDDWIKLSKKNDLLRLDRIDKLNNYLLTKGKLQFFDIKERKSNINWASSKQVIEVFESLGYDISSKQTKSGKSVQEKNIIKYINDDFVKIYLEYKTFCKYVNTYGENFIKKYKNPITGRYHSNFNQILVTGRISSSNPICNCN